MYRGKKMRWINIRSEVGFCERDGAPARVLCVWFGARVVSMLNVARNWAESAVWCCHQAMLLWQCSSKSLSVVSNHGVIGNLGRHCMLPSGANASMHDLVWCMDYLLFFSLSLSFLLCLLPAATSIDFYLAWQLTLSCSHYLSHIMWTINQTMKEELLLP